MSISELIWHLPYRRRQRILCTLGRRTCDQILLKLRPAVTVTVTVNTCELTRHNSACGKELRSRVTDQKARNLSSIGLQWSPMVSVDRIQSYRFLQYTRWYWVENGGKWWKLVETEPLKIKTSYIDTLRSANRLRFQPCECGTGRS